MSNSDAAKRPSARGRARAKRVDGEARASARAGGIGIEELLSRCDRLTRALAFAQEQAVGDLRSSDERMATLVRGLRASLDAALGWVEVMEASRSGRRKTELRWQHFDLARLVESAAAAMHPAAEARGVRLDVETGELACGVEGDEARLRQAVVDLLARALELTPGQGSVDVAVRCGARDAILTVRHTGEGIPVEVPLRQIIEMHGGTVRAERVGQGRRATLTVTLPLEAQRLSRRTDARPSREGELAHKRLLVVDDDDTSRTGAVRILEAAGAEVEACASAREALTRLRASPFHVLLSDLSTPEPDGVELLRRVRALEADQGGDVPAIAMTASRGIEEARRALAEGFRLHVRKPLDAGLLVSAVSSALAEMGRG